MYGVVRQTDAGITVWTQETEEEEDSDTGSWMRSGKGPVDTDARPVGMSLTRLSVATRGFEEGKRRAEIDTTSGRDATGARGVRRSGHSSTWQWEGQPCGTGG
jgi:hypothetical protein